MNPTQFFFLAGGVWQPGSKALKLHLGSVPISSSQKYIGQQLPECRCFKVTHVRLNGLGGQTACSQLPSPEISFNYNIQPGRVPKYEEKKLG